MAVRVRDAAQRKGFGGVTLLLATPIDTSDELLLSDDDAEAITLHYTGDQVRLYCALRLAARLREPHLLASCERLINDVPSPSAFDAPDWDAQIGAAA